jgi:hypothetical protein
MGFWRSSSKEWPPGRCAGPCAPRTVSPRRVQVLLFPLLPDPRPGTRHTDRGFWRYRYAFLLLRRPGPSDGSAARFRSPASASDGNDEMVEDMTTHEKHTPERTPPGRRARVQRGVRRGVRVGCPHTTRSWWRPPRRATTRPRAWRVGRGGQSARTCGRRRQPSTRPSGRPPPDSLPGFEISPVGWG